jgi:hypothetical protein
MVCRNMCSLVSFSLFSPAQFNACLCKQCPPQHSSTASAIKAQGDFSLEQRFEFSRPSLDHAFVQSGLEQLKELLTKQT